MRKIKKLGQMKRRQKRTKFTLQRVKFGNESFAKGNFPLMQLQVEGNVNMSDLRLVAGQLLKSFLVVLEKIKLHYFSCFKEV